GGGTCEDIAGATGATYTLTSEDVGFTIRVEETATNTEGFATAPSDVTAVVSAAPFAQTPPANSTPPRLFGTVRAGHTLTVTHGEWTGDPPPTFTYQWQRCNPAGNNCNDIPGATGVTYTLTAADVGQTIRVVETATNSAGHSSTNSAVTERVAAAPTPPGATG